MFVITLDFPIPTLAGVPLRRRWTACRSGWRGWWRSGAAEKRRL